MDRLSRLSSICASVSLDDRYHYTPDFDGPSIGRFEEVDGVMVYHKRHHDLVVDAVSNWKGEAATMNSLMKDELEGKSLPGSGTGKMNRAMSGALLWELRNRPKVCDVPLYRGSNNSSIKGAVPFTESRAYAQHWAKKGGGEVIALPRGAKGIRSSDWTSIFEHEKEWIIWV